MAISTEISPPQRASVSRVVADERPVASRLRATDPTLVYIDPTCRWEMVPARQRYLMEAMSNHCRVIFINKPRLDGDWIEARKPRAQRINERLTIVEDAYCFRFSRLGRKIPTLASAIDGAWLRHMLAAEGVEDYLLWVAAAHPVVLKGLRPRHVIYDCIDPCFVESIRPRFERAEAELAHRSTVVFCTAEALLERMAPHNPQTFLLPNACSLEEYEPAATASIPRPELLKGRTGPVIGYMGTVDWRVDTTTILKAAQRLPHFTFAIVGRVNNDRQEDVIALRALPNVIVPGPVSLEDGLAYAKAFDVGIIPFLPGEIADAINPVKMYMYLAGGKPVVTTSCRECRNRQPLVRTTRTPEEFTAALEIAAAENSAADVAARVDFARLNTWHDRAKTAMDILRSSGVFPT